MTPTSEQQLADELAGMTEWPGAAPNMWRSALARTGSPATVRPGGWLTRHWGRLAILGCTGAAAAVVIVGTLMPTAGRARHAPPAASALSDVRPMTLGYDMRSAGAYGTFDVDAPGRVAKERYAGDFVVESAGERHVIRKSTMSLATGDVRGTFLRVAMLAETALGEYVEDSYVSGSGPAAQANVTIRVAAERLPDVLNMLRELGTVIDERTEGLDVSEQVVDIEARLRNSRRVEAELLKLLDTRQNSPLADVLKVHTELDRVRDGIERLVAQQSQLGDQVRLAKILVLIRPEDAPPPAAESLGTILFERIAAAWNAGVRGLIEGIAILIQIVIGGLLWWLILAVAVIAFARAYRRGREAAGAGAAA